MKKTALAAVLIVLCGGLAACGPKPEPAAPEAPVEAVEMAPAPAPEPMPDAMPAAEPAPDAMAPATDDGMEGDGTGDDGMEGEGEDAIAPHAGGDKVTKAPGQEEAAAEEPASE